MRIDPRDRAVVNEPLAVDTNPPLGLIQPGPLRRFLDGTQRLEPFVSPSLARDTVQKTDSLTENKFNSEISKKIQDCVGKTRHEVSSNSDEARQVLINRTAYSELSKHDHPKKLLSNLPQKIENLNEISNFYKLVNNFTNDIKGYSNSNVTTGSGMQALLEAIPGKDLDNLIYLADDLTNFIQRIKCSRIVHESVKTISIESQEGSDNKDKGIISKHTAQPVKGRKRLVRASHIIDVNKIAKAKPAQRKRNCNPIDRDAVMRTKKSISLKEAYREGTLTLPKQFILRRRFLRATSTTSTKVISKKEYKMDDLKVPKKVDITELGTIRRRNLTVPKKGCSNRKIPKRGVQPTNEAEDSTNSKGNIICKRDINAEYMPEKFESRSHLAYIESDSDNDAVGNYVFMLEGYVLAERKDIKSQKEQRIPGKLKVKFRKQRKYKPNYVMFKRFLLRDEYKMNNPLRFERSRLRLKQRKAYKKVNRIGYLRPFRMRDIQEYNAELWYISNRNKEAQRVIDGDLSYRLSEAETEWDMTGAEESGP